MMLLWKRLRPQLTKCIENPVDSCKIGDNEAAGDDTSPDEPWYTSYLERLREVVLCVPARHDSEIDNKSKGCDDSSKSSVGSLRDSIDEEGDYLEGQGYGPTFATVNAGGMAGGHDRPPPKAPTATTLENEAEHAANSSTLILNTPNNSSHHTPLFTSTPEEGTNMAEMHKGGASKVTEPVTSVTMPAKVPSKWGIPSCPAANVATPPDNLKGSGRKAHGDQRSSKIPQPKAKASQTSPIFTRSQVHK
jgi:hypothetical protein